MPKTLPHRVCSSGRSAVVILYFRLALDEDARSCTQERHVESTSFIFVSKPSNRVFPRDRGRIARKVAGRHIEPCRPSERLADRDFA